jgi:hypothetical protein
MQQIICEMCGSTDLLKQDGVFICQHCGVKYSSEEAKKMFEGTVKIDESNKLTNFKELFNRAVKTSNIMDIDKYAVKILELEPKNYKVMFDKEFYKLFEDVKDGFSSESQNLKLMKMYVTWEMNLIMNTFNESLTILKEKNIDDLEFILDAGSRTKLIGIMLYAVAVSKALNKGKYGHELKDELKDETEVYRKLLTNIHDIWDSYDKSMQKCDKIDYDKFKKERIGIINDLVKTYENLHEQVPDSISNLIKTISYGEIEEKNKNKSFLNFLKNK